MSAVPVRRTRSSSGSHRARWAPTAERPSARAPAASAARALRRSSRPCCLRRSKSPPKSASSGARVLRKSAPDSSRSSMRTAPDQRPPRRSSARPRRCGPARRATQEALTRPLADRAREASVGRARRGCSPSRRRAHDGLAHANARNGREPWKRGGNRQEIGSGVPATNVRVAYTKSHRRPSRARSARHRSRRALRWPRSATGSPEAPQRRRSQDE